MFFFFVCWLGRRSGCIFVLFLCLCFVVLFLSVGSVVTTVANLVFVCFVRWCWLLYVGSVVPTAAESSLFRVFSYVSSDDRGIVSIDLLLAWIERPIRQQKQNTTTPKFAAAGTTEPTYKNKTTKQPTKTPQPLDHCQVFFLFFFLGGAGDYPVRYQPPPLNNRNKWRTNIVTSEFGPRANVSKTVPRRMPPNRSWGECLQIGSRANVSKSVLGLMSPNRSSLQLEKRLHSISNLWKQLVSKSCSYKIGKCSAYQKSFFSNMETWRQDRFGDICLRMSPMQSSLHDERLLQGDINPFSSQSSSPTLPSHPRIPTARGCYNPFRHQSAGLSFVVVVVVFLSSHNPSQATPDTTPQHNHKTIPNNFHTRQTICQKTNPGHYQTIPNQPPYNPQWMAIVT